MEINRKNYESWFLDYHEGTLAPEKVAELFAFLEENPDLRNEFEEFELINITDDLPSFTFEEKASLHKSELSEDEIRVWMLDVLEGNRTDKPSLILFLQDKPSLLEEWKIFQLTILKNDSATVFAQKNLLKKNELWPAGYEQLLIGSIENDLNLQQRVELSSMLKQFPALESEKELFAATFLKPEPVVYPYKNQLHKKDAKIIAFNTQRILSLAAAVILIVGAWFILNREAELPVQVVNNGQELKPSVPIKSEINQVTANPKKSSDDAGSDAEPTFKNNKEQPSRNSTVPETTYATTIKSSQNNNKPNQTSPDQYNTETPLTTASDNSPIEFLAERKAFIPEEEPFADVMRRPYFVKEDIEENKLASIPAEVKNVVTNAGNTVEQVTENTPLAADLNGTRLTLGSRVIRSFAWIVGKASDDRIKIKTTFNPLTGNLAAYEVETANRKWQKQF